ncbi:uncharacterized protein BX664DRAFT_254893 [Halteromyces radiatus]|uniref:uncharacterized protein n=1 Tax=Halteromyces radiatus TaxID=101107 RepID=UPI002220DC43|nr:uncharacterized protein BX664DRAFT_254893 [Halteromyces radiatus]KAI8099106.1 hypothetical protein BX664DRAFT_254893 [Halteromyces radiatus]
MTTTARSDQGNKILKTSQLTRNTVDSLLGRAIKFRSSRYVDEKLDLFKRKYAPVNQASNQQQNLTKGNYQQQPLLDDRIGTQDPYGFERPSKTLFSQDKLEPSWTTIRPIGAGLSDQKGQHSALNAVLQCLTYTPLLFNYLVSRWHSANCTVQDYCFVCALEDHMKESIANSGQHLTPRQFAGKLKKMKTGSSKDAFDVWTFFMEQIQHFLLLEKGLSLDINQGSSLERCLSHHFNLFFFSLTFIFISCKKTTMKNQQSIYQPPRVLALHLNRFDKNGNKNEKTIKFDEMMDITRLLTRTQIEAKEANKVETKYQLCGMITHQGASSIHGGHFVAYVKSSNGMWYCLDNESVQQVNAKRLANQQAYMLFYTQYVSHVSRPKSTPAPAPSVLLDVNTPNETTSDKDEEEPMEQPPNDDDDDDDDDDDKKALEKAMEEAKRKPKVENTAAIVVNHDDRMDDKRSKLDALIEREATQSNSQKAKDELLTKANGQFFDSVGRWDDQEEDMGTTVDSKEKERKALLQQMKTKRKKMDAYDLDYDRGKIKKVKKKRHEKFGQPNLFQAMADNAASKTKVKNKQ